MLNAMIALSQVVAHRLSTVERADLIIVLEKGTVLEMGTHTYLLGSGGRYAELVAKQSMRAEM